MIFHKSYIDDLYVFDFLPVSQEIALIYWYCSLHTRILYANASFLSKFAITVQNNDVNPTKDGLSLPTRLIPVFFKQIVYQDDINALVKCLRFVQQYPTQSPILKLRVLASLESPQNADGSTIYSYVQVSLLVIIQRTTYHLNHFITASSNVRNPYWNKSRIQVHPSLGKLIIVTRPIIDDGSYFCFHRAFKLIPHHLAGGMTTVGQDGFIAVGKPDILNEESIVAKRKS